MQIPSDIFTPILYHILESVSSVGYLYLLNRFIGQIKEFSTSAVMLVNILHL